MSKELESYFGQRSIDQNQHYLNNRFKKECDLDYSIPPKIIDIHLGYKGNPCNLKCVWCFDQSEQQFLKEWSFEKIIQFEKEIEKVINWNKNGFKVEEIYIAGGGEPSIYPEITSMIIDKFSSAGRNVWLTTNGVNINEALFYKLIHKAKGVLVSIPGTDAVSYKENARSDFFKKVIDNLASIVKERDRLNSLLEIDVTHVLMKNTLYNLENFILLLNKIGVDEFRVRYDIFSKLDAEQNIKGIEIIKNFLEKNPNLLTKVLLKSPKEEILLKDFKCFSSFFWPTWNPLYGVFPCAHVTDKKNQIRTKEEMGIYSLIDHENSNEVVFNQDCHRRCPSRIHWFNIYLNNNTK